MPVFYNYTENGLVYSFDDVFVPADLFREGNLWTWGVGSSGKLGNASVTDISTPVTTFSGGTNWKQVSAGGLHTAAIKTDGTLWVWGSGTYGRLGNAQVADRLTPVTTFSGGTNWKQVSCAGLHTAAIKTDGTLWIWGSCQYGRLGNAVTTGNISTPITTFAGGTNWKEVIAGSSYFGFTAAIKTDGTLWTWGDCTYGKLGNAVAAGNRSTPVTTFSGGTNWKQVSAGNAHTAAIKTDGTLWSWGYGGGDFSGIGRLGTNDTISRSTPVTTFAGGTNWKQVVCGYYHTAAIKTDGTLWAWSYNNNGQLGTNDTTQRATPVTTFSGGNNWKQVGAGNMHTAAIKTDGTLWTWGSGGNRQLGNASTTNRSTPVTTFAGGTNWKQVSCGDIYTAALTYIDPVI